MEVKASTKRTNNMYNKKSIFELPSSENDVAIAAEVIADDCPPPIPIDIGGCVDTLNYDAGDVLLNSLGRILQLDVTIKNVCPDKRVALAVFLTELDTNGVEYKRGMKILTVPAQASGACQDVTVRCIKFILPEDLDASEGLPTSICNNRQFYARVMAQYIDFDFQCCSITI